MPRMKDDEARLRAELAALDSQGEDFDVLDVASRLGIQPGRAANLAKILGFGQFSYDQRSEAMRQRITESLARPASPTQLAPDDLEQIDDD